MTANATTATRPNVIVLLADQWRAHATGYGKDPNVRTPHVDQLASQAVRFEAAISPCPVCSPARAALLTGRHAFSTGVYMNDLRLDPRMPSLGKVYSSNGYIAGWIGKWHLDGHGRDRPVPPERQHGFDQFWRAYECAHDYHRSSYYCDSDPVPRRWPGYDAYAQTDCAIEFLQARGADRRPFALFVSWGPPHDPYDTAPEELQRLYPEDALQLHPNVPAWRERDARRVLRGYYAHCSALDCCVGRLLQTLEAHQLDRTTIVVFASDHGDLLYSHGLIGKQAPFEESIRVPLLLRLPAGVGTEARSVTAPFDLADLMPTLLRLCDLPIPSGVEGRDWSDTLLLGAPAPRDAVLVHHLAVFGNWTRALGAREYRALRTERHVYVRERRGPWMLFDLNGDPYQQRNLLRDRAARQILAGLDERLENELRRVGDPFERGEYYHERWGYVVDAAGNVTGFREAKTPAAVPRANGATRPESADAAPTPSGSGPGY